MVAEVHGTFRVARVRYQDPRSRAAILVADQLDEAGGAAGRRVLQIPAHLSVSAFHVAQTFRARGKSRPWCNPRTGHREEQIAVVEWEEVRPDGEIWIDVVANNPAFVGIGRKLAGKIWRALGAEVMKHLDAGDIEPLLDAVPELGDSRARTMVEAWQECGHEDLIRWLDHRQLPKKAANKLISAYGDQSRIIELLERDPYRLLAFGMDFRTVDAIAQTSFGVGEGDPRRQHAAVIHCLNRAYRHGHTALGEDALTRALARLTGLDANGTEQALRGLYHDGGFVRPFPGTYQLRGVFLMEREISLDLAQRVAEGKQQRLSLRRADTLEQIEREEVGFWLSEEQRKAVLTAADDPVSLVLGGAGTGKTACLKALHRLVEAETGRRDAVLQMAVAGKAAKRMKEATGRDAFTIAGFLNVVDEDRIASATHAVIDEASMLDVPGFYQILRRLKGRTKLVLVGDPFQLPPIGAGKILHVLAERQDLPITTLEQVFRQGDGNSIRTVASAVRDGLAVEIEPFAGRADGVFLFETRGDAADAILDVVRELARDHDPGDFCALTATRQGRASSALTVNRGLQALLNPHGLPIMSAGADTGFSVGDRFVCDVNFWDIGLMNGSVGTIRRALSHNDVTAIESQLNGDARSAAWGPPTVEIEADGERVVLHDHHLHHCSWGYALTCHRAQGSDFDTVVVCLNENVDRSWLYTAITRARRQVVLVGSVRMLHRAIGTPPRVDDRTIALPQHLSASARTQGGLHA